MKPDNSKNWVIAFILAQCLFYEARAQEKFNAKAVFDSMYNVMKFHYPIFKERGVNWEKKYKDYSEYVDAAISQDSLFKVLAKMYGPINDFHILLGTSDTKYRLRAWGWGKPQFYERFRTDSLRRAFWNNAVVTLNKSGFLQMKTYGDTIEDRPLFIYSTSEKYAYLNITRCQLHELDSFPKTDKIALEKFIDSFVESIQDRKGLIIDLRTSYGGEDEFGYIIASRFTNKKFQANFSRIFKNNIYDSIEVSHFVEPKGKLKFLKPIIILTNDGARSAAEVFALTMKQLPQMTIIGENTFGSFGMSNYKDIVHCWYIQYPNEKFYSPQGKCLEGIGVPVDMRIENNIDDLNNKTDKVIIKAIELLRK